MLGVSILHIYAFPVDMYRIKAQSQAPLVHDISLGTSARKGLKSIINQGDVLKATASAFKISRRQHRLDKIVREDDEGPEIEFNDEEDMMSGSDSDLEGVYALRVKDNSKGKHGAIAKLSLVANDSLNDYRSSEANAPRNLVVELEEFNESAEPTLSTMIKDAINSMSSPSVAVPDEENSLDILDSLPVDTTSRTAKWTARR